MLGQHGSAIGRIAVAALTLSFLLANARAADPGAEPKSAPEPVDVEVFIGARPLRPPPALAYPAAEQRRGKEGWVILNMMIDPKGQPYEVGVLDSTGNAALEQAAVAAVQEMPFEPAKSGSTPIDSSLTLKMIFSGPVAERGASEKFRAAYKRLIAAIEAGNKEQADAELPNLQPDNLFEDAYRSFGKYLYDRQWGTEAEQLTDLKRTVAGESNNRFLPKEVFVSALAALLGLQVKQHDYGSALYTSEDPAPTRPERVAR
jgi:TonB family protein